MDDLLLGDPKEARGALFLEHYSESELAAALGAAGFWRALEERGFPGARLVLERRPEGQPAVRVLHEETELGELRAHPTTWRGHRLIEIDWIEMRDPRASFTGDRPPLPGQRGPGLGMGRLLGELFVAAARRIGAAGVLARPQHYHNAVMYHRIGFRYADAQVAGRFRALDRDVAARDLGATSWAIEEGRLRRFPGGARVEWSEFARELVLPIGPPLEAGFRSWRYRLGAWRASRGVRYAIAAGASLTAA